MKTKIIILFSLVFICSSCLNAQKNMTDKTNQYNDKGQKEGLWVDSTKYSFTETYYHNGLLSGTYKEYASDMELLISGEYFEGKRCGITYNTKEGNYSVQFALTVVEVQTDASMSAKDVENLLTSTVEADKSGGGNAYMVVEKLNKNKNGETRNGNVIKVSYNNF